MRAARLVVWIAAALEKPKKASSSPKSTPLESKLDGLCTPLHATTATAGSLEFLVLLMTSCVHLCVPDTPLVPLGVQSPHSTTTRAFDPKQLLCLCLSCNYPGEIGSLGNCSTVLLPLRPSRIYRHRCCEARISASSDLLEQGNHVASRDDDLLNQILRSLARLSDFARPTELRLSNEVGARSRLRSFPASLVKGSAARRRSLLPRHRSAFGLTPCCS